ncbi:pectin lyase-like protein [Piromyces finnis]|uniref:Pectin lyase-like protein n=1 Tax=Piromyces finnis TaxID=1754191 RepID=A0A1Y1V087_9FUNG|nr:pectin lyase-like protein [Piromyces finnis]|eukprot:ORX44372.1 pectin lyase-like protein [Piromyces finnis]
MRLSVTFILLATSALCKSLAYNNGYPDCQFSNLVYYTDNDGDWSIENNEWCLIPKNFATCWASALGYPCCSGSDVVLIDNDGEWGVENNEWCGIIKNFSSNNSINNNSNKDDNDNNNNKGNGNNSSNISNNKNDNNRRPVDPSETAKQNYSKPVAFPGADGGGKFATGGRGGEVVFVTNLNDSGQGSFRDAVSKSNRIVLFKVSGTVELKSDVVVQSNITIAGQTAPGGHGIVLKNFKLGFGGTNVICRFIGSRPGERGSNAEYDAWGGAKGANSIVDHCSIGWANDEQWGLYSYTDDFTIQYTVIGPANSFSYHKKGIHGFGIMLGRKNVSYHHNLIAHNISRNFRGKIPDKNTCDFTNNVIYNWGYQTTYGTIGHLNYVGNTLKKGPSTKGGNNYVSVADSGTKPENYSIYLTGNRFLNSNNTPYNDFNTYNWKGITYKDGSKNEGNTKSNTPFIMQNGSDNSSTIEHVESAERAYDNVLTYAGNGISSDKRISIDKQCAAETKNGTGSLVGARPYNEANSSQKSDIDKYGIKCGVKFEYPPAITKYDIIDTDGDGMPDDWEIARGLNPNSKYAADGSLESSGDYCGRGYTNIEYYLNDLTINAFPSGIVKRSPTLQEM